ncbi:MAG: thioredoxin [Verrucomicrobia bacterium]|nr:thioredoxin [Verrucomicrobiota bacterium]MCH8513897.1 thioredoxin [Kiritimatiellia bacterium]
MPGKTIEANSNNWQTEVIESDVPVLVDFWAEWCGPCRAIIPTLDQLADEYEGKLKVAKVNVDKDRELAQKFGVRSIPFLLVIKNGEVAEQMVGALSKPEFVSKLTPHLA